MRPVGGDALAQLASRLPDRDGCHDAIKPAIQIGQVLPEGAVLQPLSSSSDGDGAQQQSPERGAEGGIAALHGIAGIAQQMRQAHLPLHRVGALAAQHVGHPDHRLDGAEQAPHHGLAAAGANDVQHGQRADEHPFPPGLAADPRRGLVGTHHRACGHGGADRRRRREQRLACAGQHGADRAFADREAAEVAHQRGQSLPPDGVGVVQVDDEGCDRLTKGRAGFQSVRRRRGRTFAAAGATAAEQPYPRDVRPDRRQFDAVVNLLRRLQFGREGGGAIRAGVERGIDAAVRVRLQRAAEAGTALARRLVAGGTIGLLPLRWRQRRIVRRLGRTLEFGQPLLKVSNTGQGRFQPPDQRQQRQDQGILLRDGQLAEVDLGRHTELELSSP